MRRLLAIVVLHDGSDLHPDFTEGLLAAVPDLNSLHGGVLFINNAPADNNLTEALSACVSRVRQHCPVEVIISDRSLSRVAAINRGLDAAQRDACDAILLNADTLLHPGVLLEMWEVAYSDPLIGFVSPRSNDSDIGVFPRPRRFRGFLPCKRAEAHAALRSHLPRVTYVPVGDGFCLFIKGTMLLEFGLYDESFSSKSEADIDYMMHCNRRGYRTVLANQVFVQRLSPVPVEAVLTHSGVLTAKYPELSRAMSSYRSSSSFRTEDLITGLLPNPVGKIRILFDCSQLGSFHNGTFKVATEVMSAFARCYFHEFQCYVSANRAAFEFHRLHTIFGLSYIGELAEARREEPFAVAIRLAQPFSLGDLVNIGTLAPITGFIMLDSIAMDCQNLDKQGLSVVWEQMTRGMSLIGYISQFTRDQFRRRFDVPSTITEVTALLSTDSDEYARRPRNTEVDDYVLLVGNQFSHKHVRETVELYERLPERPRLVVFGVKIPCARGMTSYESGLLEEDTVFSLFSRAKAILYPSHCEGFGLPVMTALAHRKPVIARRLPVFEEIRKRALGGSNIHLFDSTMDMVRFAATYPLWIEGENFPGRVQRWSDTAAAIKRGLCEARDRLSYEVVSERLKVLAECENIIALGQLREELARARSMTVPYEEQMRLEARVSEAESAAAAYQGQIRLGEAKLTALLESRSWKITRPVRGVSRAAQHLRQGAIAWLQFRPGTRPRRALKALVNFAAPRIRNRSAIAGVARLTLKFFPGLHRRLQFALVAPAVSISALPNPTVSPPPAPPYEPCPLVPSAADADAHSTAAARLSPEGQRIYQLRRAQLDKRQTL